MVTNKTSDLLNDKVAKKLFTGSEAGEEYLLLIASYAMKIPYEDLKENFEIIHPNVGVNASIINSEADIAFQTSDCVICFEINYGQYKGLEQKNYSYICQLFLRQIHHKEDYPKIKPVYLINLNSFDAFGKGDFIYFCSFMDAKYHIQSNLNLFSIDINLDYLRNLEYNDIKNDELKRLLYIFVCSDKSVLDEVYEGDKLMDNIRKEINKIVDNFDLLMYYDKEKLDNEIVYNNGLEHGKKEGIKEGIQKGIVSEKREIAKSMLLKNFDVDLISEVTSLSISEIESLKENK